MPMSFEPVDGGEGRACRGASRTDNSADHFTVFFGIPRMEGCIAKCENEPLCTGIEHNPSGRCEVWTRPEGIQASVPVAGYTCLAYGSAVTSSSTAISTTETTSLQISSSTMTTSLTASTSAAGSLTWKFYQHTNCYTGAGATSLRELPGTPTLTACKTECTMDAACQGIVMRSGFADGTSPCWLVGDVDLNSCQEYPDYDFWHLIL